MFQRRFNSSAALFLVLSQMLVAGVAAAAGTAVHKLADGISVSTGTNELRLQVWSDNIVRVTFGEHRLPDKKSLTVIGRPEHINWKLKETSDLLSVETGSLRVQVDKRTLAVAFADLNGRPILREADNGREFAPIRPANDSAAGVGQQFVLSPEERIYGLGQHQSGIWNYRGSTVQLLQRNTEVGLPVLISSKGYGVLWDDPAITDIDVGRANAGILSWKSEAGGVVDYYFLFGPNPDDVIRDYRKLTGPAPLMPKWLWGFWQCKERYQTQSEMTNIVARYRNLGVPLDGIIQDWQYWTNGGWGSHEFDPARYPDPKQMVDDLHAMHAHVLISIWAKFDLGLANLGELERAGAVYAPVIPSAYPKGEQKWYDSFSESGRRIYWKQIADHLFSRGFDGWWLDASEPELGGRWAEFREFKTSAGPGVEVFNAYPLLHTTGIYQGQRASTSAKRVVILTRSAFPGQQRNAAITWSGDIHGNWEVFEKQIPAGLNFSISGIPYWNTDIGGFFGMGETGYPGANPKDKAYQEEFTRWFQFGAFCPMFRVHGTGGGKEIWQWDEATQKIMTDYIRLRYRLLPYIYSTSWHVTSDGGTMLRPLMMDFIRDTNALDVGDQFLFGDEIMVNPVTHSNAVTRSVYLPGRGDWYDFWTGRRERGGQRVDAASPIDRTPLFVRAGSILPLGPVVHYASEKSADPMELRIYRGADGAFTLYDDEGDNYNYEQGAFATIPLTWNDAEGTLTIGNRRGKYPGMPKQITFRVVLVDENHGAGGDETAREDAVVNFAGKKIIVKTSERAGHTCDSN